MIRRWFHRHRLMKEFLTVSGRGLTEYKLEFCETCPDLIWTLTKNYNERA